MIVIVQDDLALGGMLVLLGNQMSNKRHVTHMGDKALKLGAKKFQNCKTGMLHHEQSQIQARILTTNHKLEWRSSTMNPAKPCHRSWRGAASVWSMAWGWACAVIGHGMRLPWFDPPPLPLHLGRSIQGPSD